MDKEISTKVGIVIIAVVAAITGSSILLLVGENSTIRLNEDEKRDDVFLEGKKSYFNNREIGFKLSYPDNWKIENYNLVPKEGHQYKACENSTDWCGIETIREDYFKDDLNQLSLIDYLKKHYSVIATNYIIGGGGLTKDELGIRGISEEEFNDVIKKSEISRIDGIEVLKTKNYSFYRVGFGGAYDIDAVINKYNQIIFIKNGNIIFITDRVGNIESEKIMDSLQFN